MEHLSVSRPRQSVEVIAADARFDRYGGCVVEPFSGVSHCEMVMERTDVKAESRNGAPPARPAAAVSYAQMAAEVTDSIHKNFWLEERALYSRTIDDRSPDFIWGGGVMFSTLATAARHDSKYRDILRRNFVGMEAYWDSKAVVPGYEPAPIAGGGNDKYYDDNAWMVISLIEAYEITGDSRYLKRARETLDFVMSGWDDVLGGGIWWHESHKDDSKNTCANAPTAVGGFRLSKHVNGEERAKRIADGMKIIVWTTRNLRGKNGLFGDNIKRNGEVNGGQLTYNSALMLRAYLCVYALTGNDIYLQEARQMGRAAEAFLDHKTGAYRDKLRWSHLMVEADLELYRWTGEEYLLERTKTNCDMHYAQWKTDPPKEMIDQASLARQLWLMADHQTEAGRTFWRKSDRLRK